MMVKFLRTSRRKFLSNGRLAGYFLYAFGEIILVVIGILIAIEFNNWNESRRQQARFQADLDQVYTVIDNDLDAMLRARDGLLHQISIVDSLRRNPEFVDSRLVPHLLYYVDITPPTITSEVSYQLERLDFNPSEHAQKELHKSLTGYGTAMDEFAMSNRRILTEFLSARQFSQPELQFAVSDQNNFETIDLSFFSQDEIQQCQKLLRDGMLERALKSVKNSKERNVTLLENIYSYAKSKQEMIRRYDPQVKLLYSTIGIVGSGTEKGNWTENIELVPSDSLHAIWEGDVVFQDGYVKFREGNDWIVNWGSSRYDAKKLLYYGDNIKVSAGKYHAVLNLEERSYQFIKK